ncbi:SH3 domain-containing protein 3 [Linum grandiflorum]
MLAKAVAIYGDARKNVEKETEDLNRLLSLQVLEPLRAMLTAGPLEDARHLAHQYSRMRQEAEAQAAELSKRQARVRESPVPENVAKWQAAEAKMQELKANMAVLGKEASAALAAVEAQQQRLTFQRLVSLVLEPLRAMLTAGPLEDARHLAQRYSRMRQEAEAQAAELSKRQARVRESPRSRERSEMASSRGEDAGVKGKHGSSW